MFDLRHIHRHLGNKCRLCFLISVFFFQYLICWKSSTNFLHFCPLSGFHHLGNKCRPCFLFCQHLIYGKSSIKKEHSMARGKWKASSIEQKFFFFPFFDSWLLKNWFCAKHFVALPFACYLLLFLILTLNWMTCRREHVAEWHNNSLPVLQALLGQGIVTNALFFFFMTILDFFSKITLHNLSWLDVNCMPWNYMTWHNIAWHNRIWHDLTWYDMTITWRLHITWHEVHDLI